MPMNKKNARCLLQSDDLQGLFIDELGWDNHAHSATLPVQIDGDDYLLSAIAQKRGMVAWRCPSPDGNMPDYPRRLKIQKRVSQHSHENLIVFTAASLQVWQWAKHQPGKPAACRSHFYDRAQPGDSLLQKLGDITFTLVQEEKLGLTDVLFGARAAFDIEPITRRFYDKFKAEHSAFLQLIEGIGEESDREWYCSITLNRLMFVYFIQKKGFLDGDPDYLKNRLVRVRRERGDERFYSFYRCFLLRLFHDGLGGKARTDELEKLLGRVPYLNGSLFDKHPLEKQYGETIQIADAAFEKIFVFFDGYQWTLDDRPRKNDNEINPDVLGYIFEKYINQKQMGAYYTKEDITDYIGKNTIVPFLFSAARGECKIAFDNPGAPTVWDLLKNDPDRYIYKAAKHGADKELPADIAAALNPPTLKTTVGDAPSIADIATVRARKNWNKPAADGFGLPKETWREYIARRLRYEKTVQTLAAGKVRDINDLITLNLDIRQFAQDVIEQCEGADLLRALWNNINKITVLDPACGSGAFLFAAVNILYPLYDACLERMRAFVDDLEQSGKKSRPEKFKDFRGALDAVGNHPSRDYFIYKSIILNNLYGVDIMEEATEICKLRLFLKLAAQVEADFLHPNLGVEPLPDIDFNIRAGNALVGYATYVEVEKAVKSKLDFGGTMKEIETAAADLQDLFNAFRARQAIGDGTVPPEDKAEIRKRLTELENKLNGYLAECEYGIKPSDGEKYAEWLKTHSPFHWFVEFYGIVHERGGFDVVIGNPPYLPYTKVKGEYTAKNYETESCNNLYAMFVERSLCGIGRDNTGMICQLPLICTSGMIPVQKMFKNFQTYFLAFDDRPGKLFDGLTHIRATIFLTLRKQRAANVYSTNYTKWYTEARHTVFHNIAFSDNTSAPEYKGSYPKTGDAFAKRILQKIMDRPGKLGCFLNRMGKASCYTHTAAQYWIHSTDFVPYFWNEKDGQRISSSVSQLSFNDNWQCLSACMIFNSSSFFWWFTTMSDCRGVSKRDIENFPCDLAKLAENHGGRLSSLSKRLMDNYRKHAIRKEAVYRTTGKVVYDEFHPAHAKPIFDEIDKILAQHYGFTEEQLDYIINYDIKYRMGGADE